MTLLLGACAAPETLPSRHVAEPAPAVDLDPDPAVVAVSLVAEVAEVELDGRPVDAWAYRDAGGDAPASVPGPLLDVPAGALLRVSFENQLPESTTVHFHGVRLPNEMDGTDHTQPLVRPGDTFEYAFVVPDPATYWYHPHFSTPDQVWKGLYGAVRATGAPPELAADRVLVLSDTLLDDAGRVDVFDLETLRLGREGDTVLVGGQPAGGVLRVAASERWRIVNASVARFFTLALADRPLEVIGTDAGPVPEPWIADTLRVGPGDRVELQVALGPGDAVDLLALPTDRGDEVPVGDTVRLLTAVRDPGVPTASAPLPRTLPVTATGPSGGPATSRTVTLAEGVAPNGAPLFTVDGVPWPFETPYEIPLGATEEWDVVNTTAFDQTFHLHGFFFEVLSIDGAPPARRSLEDTAEVPRGATMRLRATFDVPGSWMFHTHVLDHAELGLMSHLHVE